MDEQSVKELIAEIKRDIEHHHEQHARELLKLQTFIVDGLAELRKTVEQMTLRIESHKSKSEGEQES